MKALAMNVEVQSEVVIKHMPYASHPTFYPVYEKLQKWVARFPLAVDNRVFDDLFLLYLLASKTFFDHRSSAQMFRLSLSLHLMQRELLKSATFSPNKRHLEIRWIPANLFFPFCSKPVLGCLIGFNLMDRYELFDEENVVLALQKHLPKLKLVKNSVHTHASQHKTLKMFYFEIEKDDHSLFSPQERTLLESNLNEKIKNSIQTLSPAIFMKINEEEIYKNILVLGQELQFVNDIPQSYITLDQHTGKEIIFRVILVYVSPFHRFSLKERFFDCQFTSERLLTLRHLENHPIEAHIFRLSFSRTAEFLRSDGSLDFYSARQKVVALMNAAIGEFRDYNGGILIQQQEQLQRLKDTFPEESMNDPELIETFFYALTPLEKQIVLQPEVLSSLFTHFLKNRKEKLPPESIYSFRIERSDDRVYIFIHTEQSSLPDIISSVLQEPNLQTYNLTYNIIHTLEGVFFNAVVSQTQIEDPEPLIQAFRKMLDQLHHKLKAQQILKIAAEYAPVSLDPRIGGETASGEVLRLLFEGLTRFDQNGNIENGVAESIKISPNLKEYTFKLRHTFWHDETMVSAYDFEYAWKKILSPDFKTSFAHIFHPIKNAKEAKKGLVSPDQIGIYALDDRTLKIELAHPTPYFLHLLAHTLFSPIHRIVDQKRPQWPHQAEKHYPSNGPFQLKINQPGQGFQLVKNPHYWDASSVKLDQMIITVMNPVQAFRAFQKKDLDWIGSPFGGWHSFYVTGQEDRLISYEDQWVSWCAFNTALAPFNNLKLRQAFAFAIDRMKTIGGSFLPLKPAYSPLPKHLCENHPFLFPEHDSKKARQLFQEALDEMGMTREDISPISFSYLEKGHREYVALCFKQQIEECFGIQCELKPFQWNSLFSNMTTGDFQLGMFHWGSRIHDPLFVLNDFKSGDSDTNHSQWKNADFERLLDESEKEVNPFQRSALLLKAEEILSREIPIIPLYYHPAQALVRKNITLTHRTPWEPFYIPRSLKQKEI